MLDFKTYERQSTGELTDLGRVVDLVGTDGSISFIPKNIKDPDKRVVVILTKADGTSAQVTCSEQVSADIRAKRITEGHLINLNILENSEGIPFISSQGGLVEIKVKDIAVQNFTPSKAVSISELLSASVE